MPLRIGSPLPDLSGATEWVNGAVRPDDLLGRVVLVHFWAVSCHLCHEQMPLLNRWREEYGPKGLVMVAVHMPRQEADLDVARVREDVAALGLTQPCAIDNTHAVADAFENQYVPAYFLFDRDGTLRGRTAGEVGVRMLEAPLKRQFKE
ncbi:MAG: TlpA disulfide reductase family protein [Thermodesulfobacteriota bacterium]|jgi:thiol-disulfide isomerase/thioredoxin